MLFHVSKLTIIGLLMVVIEYIPVQCQKSLCPKIFKYEPKRPNEPDRWYGKLTLISDVNLNNGVWVIFKFDRPVIQMGIQQFGQKIFRIKSTEYMVQNLGFTLIAATPVSMRFFVKYKSSETSPNLIEIRLNSKKICPQDPINTSTEPQYVTSQQELVTVSPDPPLALEINHNFNNTSTDKKPSQSELQAMNTVFLPQPLLELPDIPCGKVAEKPIGLIAFGENTTPGQWPWHVALYNKLDSQLGYTCGGSLISKNYVLTAAHCVTQPRTSEPLSLDVLRLFFGKYNLQKFGAEVQERKASKISIHPKFSYNVLFNDVAVIKLDKPVKFTDFVRPVCLWDDYVALDIVHDRRGIVVGWGFDENKQLSTTLKQVEMPVVAHDTCILSNTEFFSKVMTDSNYCAGFRNGSSACNGDSGGSMVFPKQGTSGQNAIWHIRGLVSIGVALQGQYICDSNQFIVFTDVAKYLTWINSVIRE